MMRIILLVAWFFGCTSWLAADDGPVTLDRKSQGSAARAASSKSASDDSTTAANKANSESNALVARLRRELRGKDTYRAISAVDELRRMGSTGAAVLVEALEDPQAPMAVSFSIMRALESMGPPAMPALIKSLEDEEADTTLTHQMFARWGARAANATPQLLKRLLDVNADLDRRLEAASLLSSIGSGARDAIPQLVDLLEQDSDDEVRTAALQVLSSVGEVPAKFTPNLLRCLVDDRQDERIRCAVAAVLARQRPPAPAVLTSLIQLAKSPDYDEVAISAAETLGRLGIQASSAVETLVGLLDHSNAQVRNAAAGALSNIGRETQQVLAALLPRLESTDDDVREQTLAALATMGLAARPAAPALLRILQDPNQSRWHLAVIRVLGEIHPDPRLVSRPLSAVAASGWADVELRMAAVEAMGELGPGGSSNVPLLASILQQPAEDTELRCCTAAALGKIGLAAANVLRDMMHRAHGEVRVASARALAICEPRSRDAIDLLITALSDENSAELASIALGDVGDPAFYPLTELLHNPQASSHQRAAAAVTLGRMGSPAVPTLIQAISYDDEMIVEAAELALRDMGPQPTVAPLMESIRRHTVVAGQDARSRGIVRRLQQLVIDVSDGLGGGKFDDRDIDRYAPHTSVTITGNGRGSIPMKMATAAPPRVASAAPPAAADPPLTELGPPTTYPSTGTASPPVTFPNTGAPGIEGLGSGGGRTGSLPPITAPAVDPPVASAPETSSTDAATSAPTAAPSADSTSSGGQPIQPRTPVKARGADSTGKNPSDGSSGDSAAQPLAATPPGLKTVKVFYGTNRKPLATTLARRLLQRHSFLPVVVIGLATVLFSAVSLVFSRSWVKAGLACFGLIVTIVLAWPAAETALSWERSAAGRPGPVYGVERTDTIERGVCEVTLPPIHQYGELESPSLLRLEIEQDPNKHIVVRSVKQSDRDAFFAELRGDLQTRGPNALVFVHGYNVNFDDAARRTAQMADDLAFAGTPIFFSWPSQGNWYEYREDEKQVELAVDPLKRFLLEVARESGAKSIHLIAHSMGNRALVAALKEIEVAAEDQVYFNQVVLAAPDIDADIFRDRIAPAIVSKAERVTLYASSSDLALVASRTFNSGDPRAGDSRGALVVLPGIETIDVTDVDTSLLGHSYYGDNPTVLSDIKELLLTAHPADQREWLEVKELQELRYWAFRHVAVAQRPGSEPAR